MSMNLAELALQAPETVVVQMPVHKYSLQETVDEIRGNRKIMAPELTPIVTADVRLTPLQASLMSGFTGVLFTNPGDGGGRGARLMVGPLFVDGGFWTAKEFTEEGEQKARTGARVATHARTSQVEVDLGNGQTGNEYVIDRRSRQGDAEGSPTGPQIMDAVVHPVIPAHNRALRAAIVSTINQCAEALGLQLQQVAETSAATTEADEAFAAA